MARPPKSDKWPERLCNIDIRPHGKFTIEYCTVTEKGLPSLIRRPNKGQSCIVILGHRDFDSKIKITPQDHLWTCRFNQQGKLSAVGTVLGEVSIVGMELTVILRIDTKL